jgi:hypothetical protein
VADARKSATHGGHGHETGELQAMLNNPATPLTGKLPIDYATLHDKGCRLVKFQGRDVLEVCFNRNGVWFTATSRARRISRAWRSLGADAA